MPGTLRANRVKYGYCDDCLNGQRCQSDIKNKMAADVDGSRHFSSISREAQRDLHCEILSVLEYF